MRIWISTVLTLSEKSNSPGMTSKLNPRGEQVNPSFLPSGKEDHTESQSLWGPGVVDTNLLADI